MSRAWVRGSDGNETQYSNDDDDEVVLGRMSSGSEKKKPVAWVKQEMKEIG